MGNSGGAVLTYSEGIQRYLTGSELPCFDDTAESRRPGLGNGRCLGSVDDDDGSTRPAKTILLLSVCLLAFIPDRRLNG